MDGNDLSLGKCPVMHTQLGGRSNREWWPNQLNLDILHQNFEVLRALVENIPMGCLRAVMSNIGF